MPARNHKVGDLFIYLKDGGVAVLLEIKEKRHIPVYGASKTVRKDFRVFHSGRVTWWRDTPFYVNFEPIDKP